MKSSLYPSPLKKGDTIGIFAPAGQLQDRQRFLRGVEILQAMGLQVKFPRELWPGESYLADNDANRADEFNRLIADKSIKGLISMRGGYGCLRILGKIDTSLVRDNPKIIVGFSDISILQNYLYERTGLVSLHGPVVTSLCNATEDSLARLHSALTRPIPGSVLSGQIVALQDGPKVTAPIIGGNLASLVTLLGTPYDFSWDGKIVFLEDTNEPAYKIDRMLTQLHLAGKFNKLAGLILGDFSTTSCRNENDHFDYRQQVWHRALDLCAGRQTPVWGNFPSGHCVHNVTFPLGALTVMKSGTSRLCFQ